MRESDKLLEKYVLDNFVPEKAVWSHINKISAYGYKCNNILITDNTQRIGVVAVYIEGKKHIEVFYVKYNSPVEALLSKCYKIE